MVVQITADLGLRVRLNFLYLPLAMYHLYVIVTTSWTTTQNAFPLAWDLKLFIYLSVSKVSKAASLATVLVSPSFHIPCFKITIMMCFTDVNLSNLWMWIFLCFFIKKYPELWLRVDPGWSISISVRMRCVFIKIWRTLTAFWAWVKDLNKC